MERIPFLAPAISELDAQYVAESVPQCATDNASDFQHRFERDFADYVGARHAFAVSSRTAAIHVALAALGVGPGHEVIVPEIMPASSVQAIRYLGATAVFADIDEQSWCLSAASFQRCITPRTRVVLPVDLYGNFAEMHRIRAAARSRGIAVLEDASDALGGAYFNRPAGAVGDVGVFGFDRAGTLTSGEGGMIVTACDQLADRLHESLSDSQFDYQMSPMQAAMGVAQLEQIDSLIARKRQIAAWYRQALADAPSVLFSAGEPGADCVPSEIAVALDLNNPLAVGSVIEGLLARGIDCRRIHSPGSAQQDAADSPQARVARRRNLTSYEISPCVLSLPSGTNLNRRQVESVATTLALLVAQHSRSAPAPMRLAA